MISLLAISVGNSRTAVGRFREGNLEAAEHIENSNIAQIVDRAGSEWREIEADPEAVCVMASVNDRVATPLESQLAERLGTAIWRIGRDIGVPIGECLDPETKTGADRLLNAAAAYDVLHSACVVVDAGSAITVDFVDGNGVFHGGAIAPGATMQLKALHEMTDALPRVAFSQPDDEPFGRNTAEAMLQGVYHGLRGLVWRLVERYAASYGAFPPVIATGGDAEILFANDEIVDRIVPELTLLGIAAAVRRSADDEPDGDDAAGGSASSAPAPGSSSSRSGLPSERAAGDLPDEDE